jgi:hypothetical protein
MLAWLAATRGDACRCGELAAAQTRYEADGILNGMAWAPVSYHLCRAFPKLNVTSRAQPAGPRLPGVA